jgi:hypothetical protein
LSSLSTQRCRRRLTHFPQHAVLPRRALRSGPTRYYFFYGGQRHYYGTRTWGQCNGHCDQDVYIDEAEFDIYYGNAPSTTEAAASLQMLWPSLDQSMMTTTTGVPSTARHFRVLLPDGTSGASFANAVKQDVERACVNGNFDENAGSVLARTPYTLDCTYPTVTVAIRQISTQAESGGAALTLPSMVCLVFAAVAVLLR